MTTGKGDKVFTDPYAGCEGIDFSGLGLSSSQVSRIHKLRRRQGQGVTSCTHDLAVGVTLEQLMGGDGKYQGNSLYTAQGAGGWLAGQIGMGPSRPR